ncbi:MAG: 3-deoxy-manno-octulosonate cytidylyltransferase [Pseudomonadota bacterium]
MRSVVVIPARYGSSRYPGKPLVELLGRPMILWVADLSAKAVSAENVYVATEDERIASVVTEAGYNAVMTSDSALTGTDRLAEAAGSIDADIYINVQGDEPLVNPDDILHVIDQKTEHMDSVINGYCWLSPLEDPANINIPKVIANESGQLIYMSRNPLPGYKDAANKPLGYRKQVCIYAFTRDELTSFAAFGRKSDLEACEDIEILRFLELGKRVLMVETRPGSLAVDVPEDLDAVEAALRDKSH